MHADKESTLHSWNTGIIRQVTLRLVTVSDAERERRRRSARLEGFLIGPRADEARPVRSFLPGLLSEKLCYWRLEQIVPTLSRAHQTDIFLVSACTMLVSRASIRFARCLASSTARPVRTSAGSNRTWQRISRRSYASEGSSHGAHKASSDLPWYVHLQSPCPCIVRFGGS